VQCGHRGGAGEGGGAGDRRAQGRAQRPQVGRGTLRTPADPLGGHVVRRADQHADDGEGRGVLDGGDAEVGEDDTAVAPAEQYVAGLDVAVQHPARVHLAERRRHPEPDPRGLARGHRSFLHEELLKGS
jgi:hypothetical protein